ncbi:BadF/BadG/BcrA/BcrD ATPase family protein [Globicatella sulfidifaciens]|uniref:N-acetylglucosamine kinase n=1 Tax=Globicatella sulfidifaciens TaxID=136093 RepID=UPI002891CA5C|nr:BadF/BadG/BcrA/BcrD ATPase family protein [Globicatella sulfidifaciens]MDT2767609.1 BadF/BadG/BcrA/BcrD ATPase family protein [Globicatella sulfidifaciens]
MRYILGVDGGGTKTKFECYDESGALVSEISKPTCHLLQVSRENAVEVLQSGLLAIKEAIHFQEKHDELYIGLGLAGYGLDQQLRQQIDSVCQEAFTNEQYLLRSDAEIALIGALKGKDGILVIAGTGSIAFAKFGNRIERCGGWGYQLGDEGSGYWIGRQLLTEFTKQSDGRHLKTDLYSMLRKHLSLNQDGDLIQWVASIENQRTVIAQLSLIGHELLMSGDIAVRNIYNKAAKELADLVNKFKEEYDETSIPVTYIGGILEHSEPLRTMLKSQLDAKYVLTKPYYSPAKGASILAQELLEKK